jgi:hypothetical protein
MTPPTDDESLHSLLAQGGLSGAQRDRILENVLDAQAKPRRGKRFITVGLGALLPVAALVALGISRGGGDSEDKGWLVAKGVGTGAVLEARCPKRKAGECHVGDRLIFEANGVKDGGLFAAYAECGSRPRVWYFPSPDGEMPALPARPGLVVVPQAARIGEEHGVGACSIHLWLLEGRVGREQLLSGKIEPRASAIVPITILP